MAYGAGPTDLRRNQPGARKKVPTPAPGSAAAVPANLQAGQDAYVSAQNANIDVDAKRGFQQGLSNLIGSGLAGTTVVGGMQAGVTEQATRAKAGVAADAQRTTDQLAFNYANLAQQAEESQANRATQLQLGQLGADTSLKQSAMNQPNTSGLEGLIQSLQKQIADMKKQIGTNPNSLAGTSAPSLF